MNRALKVLNAKKLLDNEFSCHPDLRDMVGVVFERFEHGQPMWKALVAVLIEGLVPRKVSVKKVLSTKQSILNEPP